MKEAESKMEKLKDTLNNTETELNEITERNKSEKKLQQYQFMEKSGHGAIFFKNLKSQYIIANNRTLEIFGKSWQEVMGKDDYSVFLNKREAHKNIEDDRYIFNTGKPKEFTKHMVDGNGRKCWFHFIKFPQFDEQGNIIGLVGIIRDITERKNKEKGYAKIIEDEKKRTEELKKAYRELQDSKDALVRSEKLAYTGRIAASIAHEIRNPLANVTISAQQCKKVIKPEEPQARHVEIIERNIGRINFLITELLNCARPPKLNLKPYNVHKVIRSVVESLKNKIRLQRIKVLKKFTFNPFRIMIDREQIERAFLNIVLNAIEAMPKKGKLTIITEINKNLFVVKIQDNGKGIPEKDIIRIFDPFFSTKPDGVGLGLTLCYGIIVSHDGTIEVESKPKKGTIFTVSLPVGHATHTQREK